MNKAPPVPPEQRPTEASATAASKPVRPTLFRRLTMRAQELKREVYALYLAVRDPRTPWFARAMGVLVVAYALSPIDLIPDFIPVLGLLDDLVLVPAGIAIILKMVPAEVMAEHRARAEAMPAGKLVSRAAAVVIVVIWASLAVWGTAWIRGPCAALMPQ